MKKILVLIIVLSCAITGFSQIQIFGKYTAGKEIEPDINIFNYGPKLDTAGKIKIKPIHPRSVPLAHLARTVSCCLK